MLPEVHEGCSLYGTGVTQGRPLDLGKSEIGTKDTPAHFSHLDADDHTARLQWLQAQKVVLWDEQDKRGWLVNGVSALLHLLRAWVEEIRSGDFASYFLLNPGCFTEADIPDQTASAVHFLMNERNLKLQLYRGEKTTFKDQVNRYYNLLEQMIAQHDVNSNECCPSRAKPSSERPRRLLEGWSFADIIDGERSLTARVANLPIEGRTWTDFQRRACKVVLFGGGFGDLIRNSQESIDCSGAHTSAGPCPSMQVPKSSYYLAALVRDIPGLSQTSHAGDEKHTTHVGSGLSWHNPSRHVFAECRCSVPASNLNRSGGQELDNYVQVLLPNDVSSEFPFSQKISRRATNNDAVIFGHNSSFSWIFRDFGDPELGDPFTAMDIDHVQSPRHDSGYTSPSTASRSEKEQELQIGIVCALPKELKAVWALLDCAYRNKDCNNPMVLGHLGGHSVVAAGLPFGMYGTQAAASAASRLAQTFPQLKFTFLIGIAGGIPSAKTDIRLGDVVVGLSANSKYPGLIQYDAGKIRNGVIELKTPSLRMPPNFVKNVIGMMMADPQGSTESILDHIDKITQQHPEYKNPGPEYDVLFKPNEEPTGNDCDLAPERCTCEKVQNRAPRPSPVPMVHYGTIATGDSVIKDASVRDGFSARHNAICVEMEAAGIATEMDCLVIRGICDYADCHKNDLWQEYAAATAAAYAKYLLMEMSTETQSRKRKHSFVVDTPHAKLPRLGR